MNAGIRPIPNQIIGFPEESFETIRTNIKAWDKLGIQVYPFFATPYPGVNGITITKIKYFLSMTKIWKHFCLILAMLPR